MLTHDDKKFLLKAIDLAEISLKKGDEPFGSILVLDNEIL